MVVGQQTAWAWARSPLAVIDTANPQAFAEEPDVRYVLVLGDGPDVFGTVGALWLSEDGRRGGFLPNPGATWTAGEMVRSYEGALERGWTPERIFGYWCETVDAHAGLRFEAPAVAPTLRALRELVVSG